MYVPSMACKDISHVEHAVCAFEKSIYFYGQHFPPKKQTEKKNRMFDLVYEQVHVWGIQIEW